MTVKKCFVIMPYGGDEGTQRRKHFDGVYAAIIAPAAVAAGYEPYRSDTAKRPGSITRDIIKGLSEADVVIADLTGGNPNVLFELGIRHAFRKSGTVHIVQKDEDIPFDVAQYRYIGYSTDLADIEQAKSEIVKAIRQRVSNQGNPDNPVHDYLTGLPVNILETGDEAQRKRLQELEDENRGLRERIAFLDPSGDLSAESEEIRLDIDELLDEADQITKQSGEHALLRLKSKLGSGDKEDIEAFTAELRDVLKSPYLDENDFMEIVKICRQLGLDGHRLATLKIARARYPHSEGILLALIDALDDSKNPQDNENGRLMVEEYLGVDHQSDGPVLTSATVRHQSAALGLLFNFYKKANQRQWILSISDSAEKLGILDSLIERNRADAYKRLGQLKEAEVSFKRAMELNPEDDQAVAWYADFLDDEGKYEEAYELFENAITLDPDDGGTYIGLGIHILNRGLIRTGDLDGSYTGPVSRKDRVKAVMPLMIRAIQLRPRQDLVQRIVRILVRADAIPEAESIAKGQVPDGPFIEGPLQYIDHRLGK